MTKENEVLELEAIEEDDYDYEGFLYECAEHNGEYILTEKTYRYFYDADYDIISKLDNKRMMIYLSKTNKLVKKTLPKYLLEITDRDSNDVEIFFFKNIIDLEYFLKHNAFYNLIIKQF